MKHYRYWGSLRLRGWPQGTHMSLSTTHHQSNLVKGGHRGEIKQSRVLTAEKVVGRGPWRDARAASTGIGFTVHLARQWRAGQPKHNGQWLSGHAKALLTNADRLIAPGWMDAPGWPMVAADASGASRCWGDQCSGPHVTILLGRS